jgi:hypothetical protein
MEVAISRRPGLNKLSDNQRAQIRETVKRVKSPTRVAELMGVSRWTVAAIANQAGIEIAKHGAHGAENLKRLWATNPEFAAACRERAQVRHGQALIRRVKMLLGETAPHA